MSSVKQDVVRMLEELPDDVSLEEIQYHLYVRQKVARGLQDARDGRTLPQDEVERRFSRWLEE